MALTTKQKTFVEAYLSNGFNATEAARTAEYTHPNKQGPRLLVNVGIRAIVNERLAEMVMSADEVLARLSAMARTDMTDFMKVYPGGTPAFDFEKAQEASRLGLIKKFKVTNKSIELELYDAQAALVHMGKHYALFTDKLKLEDWQDELLNLWRNGKVTERDIREDLGDKLADDFFKRVGPVTVGVGEITGES